MRTLVHVPEEDIRSLDALALKLNQSRAAVIRAAVERHLGALGDDDWIDRGFGFRKDRTDIVDGVAYQQVIREDRTPGDDL